MVLIFLRSLLRSVVTVNVGSDNAEENTFVPHAELLSFYSPFFKTMMSGNWPEAKTGIINLPDDDPDVFDVFQNWLYGHGLVLDGDQMNDTAFILSLWVFGDKVQVHGFQNCAIEALRSAIIQPSARSFRLKDIQVAFANSGEGSPLRKLIVDLYVWEVQLNGLMPKLLVEDYPHDFIIQFIEGYFRAFPRPSPKSIKDKRPYGMDAQHYYINFPGSSVGQEAGTDAQGG